ncbi:hypothetical protein HPB51_011324 [Rhipicephalus microplus]|uniref:Uncharacterized protein n=1 Tax=Rhipicephalus microplus TaxID=6941 RepID=A0A9J6DMZ5_RHIMP|nr:hypothetical protein HPB51_011324 [Rhipicephalus microplus]
MTPSCHVRKVVYPRIYLFGDSLTQRSHSDEGCWGSLVAEAFESASELSRCRYSSACLDQWFSCRRCDVVVRGFSGYNTRMCRDLARRNLETVSRYVDAVSKVGEEQHVKVINVFAAFKQEQVKAIIQDIW